MKKLQGQSTSNPCSISQAASVTALSGDQSCVREMNRAFKERHDYIIAALNGIPGFPLHSRRRGLLRVSERHRGHASRRTADDTAFAELLLREGDVAVVPGSAFGAPGYVRLSFACGIETLKEAVARMRRVAG